MQILDDLSPVHSEELLNAQSNKKLVLLVLSSWCFIALGAVIWFEPMWVAPELVNYLSPWFHTPIFYLICYLLLIYQNNIPTFHKSVKRLFLYHGITFFIPLFIGAIVLGIIQDKHPILNFYFLAFVMLFLTAIFASILLFFLYVFIQVSLPVDPYHVFFFFLLLVCIEPTFSVFGFAVSIGLWLGYYLMKKMSWKKDA